LSILFAGLVDTRISSSYGIWYSLLWIIKLLHSVTQIQLRAWRDA